VARPFSWAQVCTLQLHTSGHPSAAHFRAPFSCTLVPRNKRIHVAGTSACPSRHGLTSLLATIRCPCSMVWSHRCKAAVSSLAVLPAFLTGACCMLPRELRAACIPRSSYCTCFATAAAAGCLPLSLCCDEFYEQSVVLWCGDSCQCAWAPVCSAVQGLCCVCDYGAVVVSAGCAGCWSNECCCCVAGRSYSAVQSRFIDRCLGAWQWHNSCCSCVQGVAGQTTVHRAPHGVSPCVTMMSAELCRRCTQD
jgi:hypothetical protein